VARIAKKGDGRNVNQESPRIQDEGHGSISTEDRGPTSPALSESEMLECSRDEGGTHESNVTKVSSIIGGPKENVA